MQVTVVRMSDGKKSIFEFGPEAKVTDLKLMIQKEMLLLHPVRYRLTSGTKVLKSRKKLRKYMKAYGQLIIMDDTKNWLDTSSSSSSDTD